MTTKQIRETIKELNECLKNSRKKSKALLEARTLLKGNYALSWRMEEEINTDIKEQEEYRGYVLDDIKEGEWE